MKELEKMRPGDNGRIPSGLAFAYLKGQVHRMFELLVVENGKNLEYILIVRTTLYEAYHNFLNSDRDRLREIPEFRRETEEDILKEAEYLLKASVHHLRKGIKAI